MRCATTPGEIAFNADLEWHREQMEETLMSRIDFDVRLETTSTTNAATISSTTQAAAATKTPAKTPLATTEAEAAVAPGDEAPSPVSMVDGFEEVNDPVPSPVSPVLFAEPTTTTAAALPIIETQPHAVATTSTIESPAHSDIEAKIAFAKESIRIATVHAKPPCKGLPGPPKTSFPNAPWNSIPPGPSMILQQHQPQPLPTRTAPTVIATTSKSMPIAAPTESQLPPSRKPTLEMMHALVQLQQQQTNNNTSGPPSKKTLVPTPPDHPPPPSCLHKDTGSLPQAPQEQQAALSSSSSRTRPSTTQVEEGRPSKTCKFVPNPQNAAEMRLRALKDKHNEREVKRRARKAAAAAAKAEAEQSTQAVAPAQASRSESAAQLSGDLQQLDSVGSAGVAH